MTEDILKVSRKDFMCYCNPEKKARSEAIIAETKRQLSSENYPVTDANLLNTVVFALANDISEDVYANITGIHTDQWSVVTAKAIKYNKPDEDFTTYIQCDKVEAGIAATWLAMKQHFDSRLKLND